MLRALSILSLLLLSLHMAVTPAAGSQFAPPSSPSQSGDQNMAAAIQFYAQQDWDTAIMYYSKALQNQPKRTDALLGRGLSYMAKGQPDLAFKDFKSLIKIDPKGNEAFNAHMVQREMLEKQGNLDGAIAEVRLAMAIKPTDGAVYHTRAKLLQAKGDFKSALEDYNKAISLLPRAFAFYDNRGLLKTAMGDLDGAIADFDKALELNPRQPPPMIHRGDVKKKRGDYDGALADYNQALDWNLSYAPGCMQRGLLKLEKGKDAEAQEDFDLALKLDPSLKTALDQAIEKVKAKRSSQPN